MGKSRWATPTLLWLKAKHEELQGAPSTTQWIREEVLPQFLENGACASDPVLNEEGFQTQDELVSKLDRWFRNQQRPPALPKQASKPAKKAVQPLRRKSARDIYIQEHKEDIMQSLPSEGRPQMGDFQKQVSQRLNALSEEEKQAYEEKANEANAIAGRQAAEMEPEMLTRVRSEMSATMLPTINQWSSQYGIAICMNITYIDDNAVRVQSLLCDNAKGYSRTEQFADGCNNYAMWYATSQDVKLPKASLIAVGHVYPDWTNGGLPKMPTGSYSDQPELLEKLIRDFLNAMWTLQGGAKRTAWGMLSRDASFIHPSCWPDGVPQKDPGLMTVEQRTILFTYLQHGPNELPEGKKKFQFQEVLSLDKSKLRCQDAYTQCNAAVLDRFWTPGHYKYRDLLRAQMEEATNMEPYHSPSWKSLPLPAEDRPALLCPTGLQLAYDLCHLPVWRTALDLVLKQEGYYPAVDDEVLWQVDSLPTVLPTDPPQTASDLQKYLQDILLSESFFNPISTSSTFADTMLCFFKWWNLALWIHKDSSTCFGSHSGTIVAVLAAGKVYHNISLALGLSENTSTLPDYVSADSFTHQDLGRMEAMISQIVPHLEQSIEFCQSNMAQRHTSYNNWVAQQTSQEGWFETEGQYKAPTPGWSSFPASPVAGPSTLQWEQKGISEQGSDTEPDDLPSCTPSHHEGMAPQLNAQDTEETAAQEPELVDLDSWVPLPRDIPLHFAIKLRHLHELCLSLPSSIREGTAESALGVFGENLEDLCQGQVGEELWERLDPTLNGMIGYDKSAQQLSKQITTGRYGLLGVHNTFAWLVLKKGVSCALLEGKLQKVVEATKIRVRRKNVPDEVQAHRNLLRIWGVVKDNDEGEDESTEDGAVVEVNKGAKNKGKAKQPKDANDSHQHSAILPEGSKRARKPSQKAEASKGIQKRK